MKSTSVGLLARTALRIKRWSFWSRPAGERLLLVAVQVLALILTTALVARARPSTTVLIQLSTLLALSTGYGVLATQSERVRRYLGTCGGRSRPTPMSVWSFAGLLVLPPGLAALLVIGQYVHVLIHQIREPDGAPGRLPFVVASAVLAEVAGAGVLMFNDATCVVRGGLRNDPIMLAAAAAFTLVDLGLVVAARRAADPSRPWRETLPDRDDVAYELASLVLGMVTAELLVHSPILLAAVIIPVGYMHRGSMLKGLQQASRTDAKTGVLNPVAWSELAARTLARCARENRPAAILVLDVDHFKSINDEHGHLVGDQVLLAMAQCLRGELRDRDALGRFGGDEFVVVLEDITAAGAEQLGRRLHRAVNALDIEGIRPRVSIGVAHTGGRRASCTVEELLADADRALYAAKSAGRDQVAVAPPRDPSDPSHPSSAKAADGPNPPGSPGGDQQLRPFQAQSCPSSRSAACCSEPE